MSDSPQAANFPKDGIEQAVNTFACAHSPVVFYLADPDGVRPFDWISPNIETITGHEARAVVADHDYFHRHIHPDDAFSHTHRLEKLRATGSDSHEFRVRSPDGSYVWLRDDARLTEKQGTTDAQLIGCMSDISAEKQACQKLEESEQERERLSRLLRDAVESSPHGLTIRDADGRLVVCNRAYSMLYGEQPDALLGKTQEELARKFVRRIRQFDGTPLTDSSDDLERWRRRQTSIFNDPVEIELDDDSWLLVTGHRTSDGGFALTRTDITKQKRNEIALRESLAERRQREEELKRTRETLEDAIESLSEGFALFDSDDYLVMCNTRYRDFHHVSQDIIKPGMHWVDLIKSDLDSGLYVEAIGSEDSWLRERKKMRRELQTNLEYEQSDGRWASGSNRRTRQGGTVVTLSDITDRKKIEEELLESEGLVRLVLESCPVPLAMNRLVDGEYVYISPSNAELLGIDTSDGPFYSPDSYADPSVREDYVVRLRKEQRIDDMEVQRIRADGTPFWVSMSSRLIEYKGEPMIVSSIFDLTERHAVAEEMARQRQALYQSEKLSALGSLLASVAHELNNPLTIVVAQSMLLEELVSDEDISKRAAKITTAADRCARIVKAFLAMARQQPTEYRAVNLNEIVESALEVTSHALRTSEIETRSRLTSKLPAIQGDADQLTQVITNLILNAQQAMEDMEHDGRLKITTSHRPATGELVVKIKDNGPGIGTELRSRIFEPFFTTKKMEAGTGIGLAICHRIIESHGGTISVEDSGGPGACFAIRFPESTRSNEETSPTTRPKESRSRLSLLVVDDEAEVLDVLAEILRSDGHAVNVAESGELALQQIRIHDYDAVISDLRMPGLDGPELYEILKQELPSMVPKLLFLTGDTMTAGVRTFLDESGRPYLEKPINPRELRTLVRQVAVEGAR